jgi:hypothetical protein
MSRRRLRVLISSLVLLASLAALTVAAPATAAEPKCGNKVATIVGTDKGETIVGTAKADVIVALGGDDTIRGLGGADRICGGSGQDRLLGGAGKDKLLGGAGNDRLNGGTGLDICLQGSTRGAIRNCEFPSTVPAPVPAPAPAPAPAPKPDSDGDGFTDDVDACPAKGASAWGLDGSGCPLPPPDSDGDGFTDDVDACPAKGASAWGLDGSGCPLPPPKVLVIAYTEVDGVPGYTTGDVMISRLLDTSRDGRPSAGDTVEMGRYPLDRTASGFGDWGVKSHVVDGSSMSGPERVWLWSSRTEFYWDSYTDGRGETYFERSGDNSTESIFKDGFGVYEGLTHGDAVAASLTSVSQPVTPVNDRAVNFGDQPFVEVDIYP